MFCPDCGKKNNSDAVFCDECGARLIKPSVNPKSGKERSIFGLKNQKFTIAIIIFISLVALVLISNFNSSPSQEKERITTGNDTGTFYDGKFFSFSHEKMFSVALSNKENLFSASDDPKKIISQSDRVGTNYSFSVQVYEPVNTTETAYEIISKEKNRYDTYDSYVTHPINSIQIAGVTGYEFYSDLIWDDGDGVTIERDIFFVKNGLLYKIEFMSMINNFEPYQENMDMIINSFKTK